MPNIASAKKRVRVTATKTLRNKLIKSSVKTAFKAAVTAITENKDDTFELFKFAVKKLDQAGSKGVFHKNKVANKKAQLQKLLNAKVSSES